MSQSYSRLALGTWALAGDKFWGPQARTDSVATIHAALDAGVTFIDTAPLYGDGLSEEIVGEALHDRRERAFVATKISEGDMTPERAIASCEASLKRLRTDHVDLLQIHWLGSGERLEEVIAAMETLRAQGKARALGVCNFGPTSLARLRAVGTGWITNQLPYNLIWRAIEFEVTGACQRDGLGVLCYSPLQQGLLSGRFRSPEEVPVGRHRTRHFRGDRPMSRHGGEGHEELTFATLERIRTVATRLKRPMADVALAWLLHQPAVTSVIFGARSPQQVADNVASSRLSLDDAALAELARATDPLKHALGPDADLWAGESRIK